MTHLSLFSGIGGLDLAAEWAALGVSLDELTVDILKAAGMEVE